jgi:hypothetical protein
VGELLERKEKGMDETGGMEFEGNAGPIQLVVKTTISQHAVFLLLCS